MNNWGARTEFSMTVKLNVYDLVPANGFLYGIGMGFYHSGVEINGQEYTYQIISK